MRRIIDGMGHAERILRGLAIQRGIGTHTDLAAAAGVHRVTLRRVLDGETSASDDTVVGLARALGVSRETVARLLGGRDA